MAVIMITAGSQLILPADWNPLDNKIELIGVGRAGFPGKATTESAGAGGNGGGYSTISNFGVAGQALTIDFTNDVWISNTESAPTSTSQGALAKGGATTTTPVGTLFYSGGNGGASAFGTGGGGGGAAGPTGGGSNGLDGDVGANGGASASGASGGAVNQPGSNGAIWTATSNTLSGTGLVMLGVGISAGPGGGGGGGDVGAGGAGGYYGGGGGGGGFDGVSAYVGGTKGPGLIVLTYTPIGTAKTGNMMMIF